jgi:hypothetical protein
MHMTLEYMIMVPLLILQIFLFPYTAGLIMNNWTTSRETLQLQEIASSLGSSIQQLYATLSHDTISTVTVTDSLSLPDFIDGYVYTANATLRTALDSVMNSTRILDLTLRLNGTQIQTSTTVILGANINWNASSVYVSNSNYASVVAQKLSNSTILITFTS